MRAPLPRHLKRRAAIFFGVSVLGLAVFVTPVSAQSVDSEDTFETTDAPLTADISSVVDISHNPGEDDNIWTPGTSVVRVTVDLADANGLAGAFIYVCIEFQSGTLDCLNSSGTTSEWGAVVASVSQDVGNTLQVLTDPSMPSWSSPGASFVSGDFDSTVATIQADFAIGTIARKTTTDRWRVAIIAGNGTDVVPDSTGWDYQVEGYVAAFSGVTNRDLGEVATGAWGATIVSQSLTGIVANADWKIQMEAVDATWANGGSGADATLVTSNSPGANAFALKCASGVDPDAATGTLLSSAAPVDIASATGSALTDSTVTGSTNLRCRVRNGTTAAGNYSGTVQTTLTLQ